MIGSQLMTNNLVVQRQLINWFRAVILSFRLPLMEARQATDLLSHGHAKVCFF